MDEGLVNQGTLLVSVVSHPGFLIVKQLIEDMCRESTENLVKFEGYDPQQIMTLHARAKCAYELRDELYLRINTRIQAAETQQQQNVQEAYFSKPEDEKVDDSNDLREKALQLYDSMNPIREESAGGIPGTYLYVDGKRY